MNPDLLPKNWLIVDDHVGDAELIASAIPEGSKVVDIAHDLKTAEMQLKQKIYDIVVLDYYFKGTKETGVDLIPIIRDLFPGLPLIMVSSSDEGEIVKGAIRNGADVFVKKYPNVKLLKTTLAIAAVQAQELRASQSDKGNFSHLFMTNQVRNEMKSTIRNRNEKVLISGHRGCGKTTIAKVFAAGFMRNYYKNSPRSIIYVDCSESKVVEEKLFGDKNSNQDFGLSAFERAMGGVLILDNIDTLSEELQQKLKKIFLDNEVICGKDGTVVNLRKIKIISTIGRDMAPQGAAFVAAATDLEVVLEPISELYPFAEKIVEKVADRKIPFTQKALDHLATAIRIVDFKMGFLSLSSYINNAICHALEEGKNKVYQADFPPLDAADIGLRINVEKQVFHGKDGELLTYAVRSGRNFPAAQKLLKKVMVSYATEMYEGNVSAAAEALGISRASMHDAN